ncbi:MAG: laccase domain-containing protein [Actinomycetia bacterium]|nr:laccase domain-containing protein [Actinomycetes bacterium]
MISPPGIRGVAFGTRIQRDGRTNEHARAAISTELGIPSSWATIHQVHGEHSVLASEPRFYGDGDGLFTDIVCLPMAIATADCVPVVLIGERYRAVTHAGWRGIAAGVVPGAAAHMEHVGDAPQLMILGPHICGACYEVGTEVNDAIGGFASRTRKGTNGADLAGAIRSQLSSIETTDVGVCTYEDDRMASYREDATKDRQVTVVWIP